METKRSIGGISLGGGRKENFFFSLLEFFPHEKRWFLSSLRPVRDEVGLDGNEAITNWAHNYQLHDLMIDFPTSEPLCNTCQLSCPGTKSCHHPVTKEIRNQIDHLLNEDRSMERSNPKEYEQKRNEETFLENKKAKFQKKTTEPLLSKSFKRKLKKGFLPYWNRPIDFWIWKNYYDKILNVFNVSYDSFGNTSIMLLHRFNYLLKHLPKDMNIYESSIYIILIELCDSNIITKKDLEDLVDFTRAPIARIEIAKAIEKKYKLFIYSTDLESIAKYPKAFDSFILSVAGLSMVASKTREIDKIEQSDRAANFVVPYFS